MGLKGQTGVSTQITVPKTKKEKKDYKKYKKGFKRNYFTTYKCPNCTNINKEPNKNHEGIPYCGNCIVKYGKFYEMKHFKSYDVNTKRFKKKRTNKNKKRSKKNHL